MSSIHSAVLLKAVSVFLLDSFPAGEAFRSTSIIIEGGGHRAQQPLSSPRPINSHAIDLCSPHHASNRAVLRLLLVQGN